MAGSPLASDVGGDLLVVLRASAPSAAGQQSLTTLTCESLGGTTVAVLEVDAVDELVAGLQSRLEERLSALLAKSGTWSQRVRLAFPDGCPLQEPSDTELSVSKLLAGDRWREAEATREAYGGRLEVVETPSSSSNRPSSKGRRSLGGQELEKRLAKLKEAKHLPLNEGRERRQNLAVPSGSPAGARGGGADNAAARRPAAASSPRPRPAEAGDRVLMASSRDEEHPADNVVDGSDATYWISTGLYPQEILLELACPTRISSIRLATTNVRSVRIEGCSEPAATTFEALSSAELEASRVEGRLQTKELKCQQQSQPTRFVKTTILSGWNDFCSVHRIVVE